MDEQPASNAEDLKHREMHPTGRANSSRPCPGCHISRLPDLFSKVAEKKASGDVEESAADICNNCITYGVPARNALEELPRNKRAALVALSQGKSQAEAARIAGVDSSTIKHAMSGRDSGLFREAFRQVLIMDGMGADEVALNLRKALLAEKPMWNNETNEWDMFPDNTTRLNATKYIAKLHDLEQPNSPIKVEAGSNGVTIIMETNIGDGKEVKAAPLEYTVEAEVLESGTVVE